MQEMIRKRLESNCFGSKSIPIYGRVYHLYTHEDVPAMPSIVECINECVLSAQFFEPETAPETVALNVCDLMLIDPMLLEAYLGVRIW